MNTGYTDLAMAVLISSTSLLGIGMLILITLRLAVPMEVVYKRLTEKAYNGLYKCTLYSVIVASVAIVATLVYFMTISELALYIMFYSLGVQIGFIILALLIAFCPPKCRRKKANG